MERSEEERAFRRLKHIERRLASIKYEKKLVERHIRWINNLRIVVLISAASTVGAYLFFFVPLSYFEGEPRPHITASGMVALFIIFVFSTLLFWEAREKREMQLTDIKRGMESALKELEREKEEIFRHYPALREREIKVRFAISFYRLVEALSVISIVVLIGLFFITMPDVNLVFISIESILIIGIVIPEALRVKKYTMQNKQNRRKALTPDIAFETEEKYDIMQYKRV